MIPKRLYTTWVGCPGRDIYTDAHRRLFSRCFDSWRRLMPDYAVTVITRENVFDCGFDPLIQEWYDRGYLILNWVTPQWLHQLGGIYVDMDMEALQRFDNLLGAECFVGRETDGYANCAIVGAVQGHPLMAEVLKRVKDSDIEEQNEGGPRLYTKILREWGWQPQYDTLQQVNGVTIYDSEAFYPFLWDVPLDQRAAMITPRTIAVHHWASSWSPQTAKVVHA